MNFWYGFAIGAVCVVVLWLLSAQGTFKSSSIMIVRYQDGSWFKGERKSNFVSQETPGTHHFVILEGSPEFEEKVGTRVAVPINSAKFFEIIKY